MDMDILLRIKVNLGVDDEHIGTQFVLRATKLDYLYIEI